MENHGSGDILHFTTNNGEELLEINKGNGITSYPSINILDKMAFYKNKAGSNSFKIGDDNNCCFFTDEGYMSCDDLYCNGYISVVGNLTSGGNLNVSGKSYLGGNLEIGNPDTWRDLYVSGDSKLSGKLYVGNEDRWSQSYLYGETYIYHGDLHVASGNVYSNNISSDRRLKKNIKNSTTNALNIIKQIKHKQFEMKKDDKHYNIGYIAQEMEEIDSNFVLKEENENGEERYYINELPILATLSKAIQEQQEQIEQLQEENKQKDKIIADLIKRIETLEKGAE